MKRNSILLVMFLSFALTLVPQMSSALGLEIGLGYFRQDLSGDFAYKPLSLIDTLDIEEDLGLDKEDKLFARVKAELPLLLPNIYFMATPSKFEGTGSKTQNFTFGDITFNVTAPFDTKIQMDFYDICFYYPIPFIETATLGKVNAELGLNARIVDFDAKVTGLDAVGGGTVTESVSEIIPVPMLYAGIQFKPIDFINVEAEVRGIAYSSNHYYDIIGRVKIRPMGPVFVAGGYRLNDIKIDYSDIEASIKLRGPFIETGVMF
jgi:outer membrane protein